MMRGAVNAVSISKDKGMRKSPQPFVDIVLEHGLAGDAHGGVGHRQVSLLALESIKKMQAMGIDVHPGDFAENITLHGVDLAKVSVGTRLSLGDGAMLEITQLGKECHERCAIYYQAGDCVMPREGVFARVLRGGQVKAGDEVLVWPKLRILVITMSDRCSRHEAVDESGPALAAELALTGASVATVLLADDYDDLVELLTATCDQNAADIVLTTGGTGLSPRDVTPEATLAVIERVVPGIAENMRAQSLKVTQAAMLSRAVAGTRKKTLIINLPGSKKGALECLRVFLPVLPHAYEVMQGQNSDCGRLPQ
ncbi:MAG: Molybdopterin adenylyltransferase [Firmicutes bacterium]|nr:Molybdopterin adenylyltransferase [Bacillota bacterium]